MSDLHWTQKAAATRLGVSYDEYAAHLDADERHCWDCKQWKPVEQFRKRWGYSAELSSQCIDCHRDYMRDYMFRRYHAKKENTHAAV